MLDTPVIITSYKLSLKAVHKNQSCGCPTRFEQLLTIITEWLLQLGDRINCLVELIMKERWQRKENGKKLALYNPSSHSQRLARYYNRTAPALRPILRSLAYRAPLSQHIPLYHLLRATATLFLMNELELLLVVYRLQELNWDIFNPFLADKAQNMNELVCSPGQKTKNKQGSLLLMLVCAWAKTALNDGQERLLLDAERVCVGFRQIFEEWLSEFAKNHFIHPRVLNCIHKLINKRDKDEDYYNFMVDHILQLSHTYNPQKDIISSPETKPRKKSSIDLLGISYQAPKVELKFPPANLLDSVTLEGDTQINSINVFEREEVKESQHVPSYSFLGASFPMNIPMPSMNFQQASYRQEADCDYLEVGLCQGESAELFFLGNPSVYLEFKEDQEKMKKKAEQEP